MDIDCIPLTTHTFPLLPSLHVAQWSPLHTTVRSYILLCHHLPSYLLLPKSSCWHHKRSPETRYELSSNLHCNKFDHLSTLHLLPKGHQKAGKVSLRHVYEIAKIKSQDPAFARVPLESVCKTIIGSARSMGIKIIR